MRKSPSKSPDVLFGHLLDSIQKIREFLGGMSFAEFVDDEKTQAAVERKLLVISEVAIRLGHRAEELCPEIPWHDIRGTGNWIRHQYDDLDVESVWDTVHAGLPPLEAAVKRALTTSRPS